MKQIPTWAPWGGEHVLPLWVRFRPSVPEVAQPDFCDRHPISSLSIRATHLCFSKQVYIWYSACLFSDFRQLGSRHTDSAMVASLARCMSTRTICVDGCGCRPLVSLPSWILWYEYYFGWHFSVWHLGGFMFFVIKNSTARNTLCFPVLERFQGCVFFLYCLFKKLTLTSIS